MEEQIMQKPTDKRRFHFSNLQRNICEQIWDIGQDYYKRLQDPRTKPRHVSRTPVQAIKFFYFLYLTGARLYEPLLDPKPKIEILSNNGKSYIRITKVNEKHFSKSVPLANQEPSQFKKRLKLDLDKSIRETVVQNIPILDVAEQNMWNFITEGGTITDSNQIFRWNEWASIEQNQLSRIISNNFRTDLNDPMKNEMHINTGISPQILRHMRTFNFLFNHKVPKDLIIRWMGWDDDKMFYEYFIIKSMLQNQEQLKMLEDANLLTNLTLNSAWNFI